MLYLIKKQFIKKLNLYLKNKIMIYNILDNSVKAPTIDRLGYSLDLYSPDNYLIKKGAVINIPSGISLNIPEGYVGMLLPAGELAFKYSCSCPAELIPTGFTREITISLVQPSTETLYLSKGQKIAQVIFIPALNLNRLYGSL